MKHIFSPCIGTQTDDDPFRPALEDRGNSGSWMPLFVTSLRDHDPTGKWFLCEVKEPARLNAEDIEMTPTNAQRMIAAGVVARGTGTIRELFRNSVDTKRPDFRARQVRLGMLRG